MSISRRLFVLLACLWAAPVFAQTSGQMAGNLGVANACVVMPVAGMGTGSVQVVGTFVGTVSFTVANTGDAADYKALNMAPSNSSTQVTSTTAAGLWSGSVAGYRFFRACMTSYTSGTAGILLSAAATGGGGAGAVTVDLTGSSFSGNAAASATGSAVPAAGDYLAISVGGTLTGLTAGQATMANSVPVTLASNQSSLTVLPGNTANTTAWLVTGTGGLFPASQSGTWNITNVSGTVSLPTGASTAAKQPALGTAGTASADVLSIQGIASMTPILATLSGTNSIRLQDGSGNALTSLSVGAQRAITVSIVDSGGNQVSAFGGSGGTASAFGSAFPSGASSGTASGFYDGTNMQGARVVDADTSGGTFYALATNNVFRTSGTPVEAGTSSNPWNVVFPSAQTVTGAGGLFPATQSGTWNVTNVSGTVSLPTGASTAAKQPALGTAGTASADVISVQGIASMTPLLATVTNAGTFAVQVTTLPALPTGANVIGALSANQSVNVAQMNGVTPLMGAGNTGTGSPRVTIATDQVAIPITVASLPSHAVTNAGTFSVQVTSMPADATELPAASALADAMANPTTPLIGAALMAYNGATWDRLQPALDYAQNSTTSGQTGSLVQGAVTTSAPTYTSGRTSPVSLDTSGSLRVAVVSGSTGNAAASNTGSAVPTQADYSGINVGGTLRGQTGVNPSGSIYAGQVDFAAVAGATTSVNNGTVDAGTLRVTLASDSTGLVKLATGANTIGALTANQSVNVAQINGVTTLMGNGVSGTGAQRVTIASDSTGTIAATESGTWTVQPGNTANTTAWLMAGGKTNNNAAPGATNLGMLGGLANAAAPTWTEGNQVSFSADLAGNIRVTEIDPCSSVAKVTAPFSLTARTLVIAAAASKKNYICGISVVAGAAEIFNIDEGTGTTCQTGTAAVVGSTTAANGMSFAANGGMAAIGGNSTVIAGLTANVDTCIVPSGSNRLAGFLTYVQR